MQNFIFQNPVKILFGKGKIGSISAEIPASARVLVAYGGGSAERNGVLAQIREALKGRTTFEFGGIEPNPTYETLMRAVEVCRRERIDFLLAVGGGSVIDGAKFIAAAVPFKGEPWDILARRAPFTEALPFGAILTLPATGSEMNAGAVISRAATKDKLVFVNPAVFPRFSVLDPAATLSLPARQIANGVIDSFVHVLEQYLTYPSAAPLQDRMAEGVLLTLIEEGPKTLADPQDYDARANLMLCATMALNGVIAPGVPQDWSTHMLGHELTALYGLDHGQTLAVVLPANLRVRRETKREKLLQYARRVWGVAETDEAAAIEAGIARTAAFFELLGAPTSLKGYGVTCDVDAVLSRFAEHHPRPIGERNDVSRDVARRILEMIV